MKAKKKNLKFEEALRRLSEVVDAVEDGETSLEDAIALYKEGLKLSEECGEILTSFEAEILSLQKKADETFSLLPFEVR